MPQDKKLIQQRNCDNCADTFCRDTFTPAEKRICRINNYYAWQQGGDTMEQEQQQKEKMTLRKAIRHSINSFTPGEKFGGIQLHEKVAALYPKCTNSYTDTILREARKICREKYRCVDKKRSIYERLPD